jgi:hypothetical protein
LNELYILAALMPGLLQSAEQEGHLYPQHCPKNPVAKLAFLTTVSALIIIKMYMAVIIIAFFGSK